jgi:hypothetical protein
MNRFNADLKGYMMKNSGKTPTFALLAPISWVRSLLAYSCMIMTIFGAFSLHGMDIIMTPPPTPPQSPEAFPWGQQALMEALEALPDEDQSLQELLCIPDPSDEELRLLSYTSSQDLVQEVTALTDLSAVFPTPLDEGLKSPIQLPPQRRLSLPSPIAPDLPDLPDYPDDDQQFQELLCLPDTSDEEQRWLSHISSQDVPRASMLPSISLTAEDHQPHSQPHVGNSFLPASKKRAAEAQISQRAAKKGHTTSACKNTQCSFACFDKLDLQKYISTDSSIESTCPVNNCSSSFHTPDQWLPHFRNKHYPDILNPLRERNIHTTALARAIVAKARMAQEQGLPSIEGNYGHELQFILQCKTLSKEERASLGLVAYK